MNKINCIVRLCGIKMVMKAELLWTGYINIVLYVNHRKDAKLTEFSYTAGGKNNIYLVDKYEASKYTRLLFRMKWNPDVYSANEACYIVAERINNIVIK